MTAMLSLLARPETAVLAVAHCSMRKLGAASAWFGLLAVAVDRQGEEVGG